MTRYQLCTSAFIIAMLLAPFAWNGLMLYFVGWDATVTRTLRAWTSICPGVPGLVAVVMVALWMHWFLTPLFRK